MKSRPRLDFCFEMGAPHPIDPIFHVKKHNRATVKSRAYYLLQTVKLMKFNSETSALEGSDKERPDSGANFSLPYIFLYKNIMYL
jgi:hypothetical protein